MDKLNMPVGEVEKLMMDLRLERLTVPIDVGRFSVTPLTALATVIGAAVILYLSLVVGRRERGLPPGPPTLPIIGNLHQMPTSGTHFQFTEWAKQYGGIYSLKLGPATAVVISDRNLIKSLIDKKSSIYSTRPDSYVSYDLMTKGDHLLVMKHGKKWQLFRKLIHQVFNEQRVEKDHIKVVEAEATQMCVDIMRDPAGFMKHPGRFSNSVVMSLITGTRTPHAKTSHAQDLYKLMEEWSKVMEPGATPPVEIFPFLHYIPQSMFNNWRTRASAVGTAMQKLYGAQVQKVIDRRSRHGSTGSLMDSVLDQQDKLQLNRNELNFLCGVLMEGGSDTSSSILLAFIQAMVAFPEVQKKAQEEIDAAFPPDSTRSPSWQDFEKLPYINCLVKETMRWRPVTPLSFPHATSAEDIVAETGYRIPKDTTVILNVWGMHMEKREGAPPPELFVPERYEKHNLLAPSYAVHPDPGVRDHFGYGAGRRICPGIHLAERNLWVGMAKLLWAFEFKQKGARPVTDQRTGYCEGFLSAPLPFEAEINLRSEKKRGVLENEFSSAQAVFGKYDRPEDGANGHA